MRSATTLVLATILVGGLAACSAPAPSANADCKPTAAGSVSDAVEVTGDFGAKPKVTIDAPLTTKKTERTVVIEGDGDTAVEGDTVNVDFTLFNGKSGDELTGTEYTEGGTEPFTLDEAQPLPGLVMALECSNIGSRIVGVIAADDAFGDTGQPDLGVGAGEPIVFVADVVSIEEPATPPLPKADGEDQPVEEGFPTVELDADGRPTITIPDTAPPTELQLTVLKKGDGEVVESGANVVVHYVGINWNTKKIFDESWARGEPATFNTGQVIAGFTAALEGQTVGSQVLVVIPPAEGYGEAGSPPDIGGTDTLVFVVDILGIA